jgi:hypothetical protein
MNPLLSEQLEKVRQRLGSMRSHRLSFRQRLLDEASGTSRRGSGILAVGLRGLRLARRKDGRQPWAYYCLRLEELIEEGVLAALLKIQGRLSAWGLELAQARRKLSEELGRFPSPVLDKPSGPGLATGDEIFPYQAQHTGEAVTALLEQLPPDVLGHLDRHFQAEVLDSGGGLWTLLAGGADGQRRYQSQSRSPASMAFWNLVSNEKSLSRELREELMKRARVLVGNCLQEVNLSGLLLERNSAPEQLEQTIRERVWSAQGTSFAAGAWQHVLFVLPSESTTAELRATIEEALGDTLLTVVEAGDALVVNWETSGLSLREVAGQLAGEDAEIGQVAEKLHTRRDVTWTPM